MPPAVTKYLQRISSPAGGDEPAALVVVPHRVGDLGLKRAWGYSSNRRPISWQYSKISVALEYRFVGMKPVSSRSGRYV